MEHAGARVASATLGTSAAAVLAAAEGRVERAQTNVGHELVRAHSAIQRLHHNLSAAKVQAASLAFGAEVAALTANPLTLRLQLSEGHLR